jgi:DNA-binding transcriptional LysR family regulator
MALDLYQLKTFFVFAKIRKVTQTAERLYVTQSAVSHALKKLEKSIGKELVIRRGGKYFLTEVGEMLFSSCERIFQEIESFEEELASGGILRKQSVYLGAPVEFGTTVLIKSMECFFRLYPNIHVNFLFSHFLEEPLMRDEVDLAVDCKTHNHPNVERIFLFKERYATVASPEYIRRFCIEKIKDLERVRILSLDEKGEWWNNFLLAIPIELRPNFKDIIQINHVRGLINAAIEGIGVSFLPRYTVESELKQNLLVDLFPSESVMDDEFCIYLKKGKRGTEKNKAVIDFLIESFSGFSA